MGISFRARLNRKTRADPHRSPSQRGSLKQRLVSAVGWSLGIKLAFQLVTWAMTLIVIRLLSPDDYGLMAISQVFANFMVGFGSIGFAAALIQREETPKAIIAYRYSVVLILISVVLTILLSLAAYPIADWYQEPRLVPLIQVSSLGFLLTAFMTLPRAYLTKSLRVRPMFMIELSSGLVGAGTVVLLAYGGYGVWALMLGWLVSNVARLLGFIALTPEYYLWPRLGVEGTGPLFSFGLYKTFEYTLWIAYTSADVLIISRWLGPTALGVYAVALNFATMPLTKIAPILNLTAFPAFAMVQGRPEQARLYALKSLRMMATISVPVFFGIWATSSELVDLAFGPNWVAAKPVLGVLALATTFRAILLMVPNYLQGIGDSKAGFWCTGAATLIFPPAFVIGCQWGILGVAYAWLIGYPIVYAVNALIVARRGGLDIIAIVLAPVRPMAAGAVMIFAVVLARVLLPKAVPEIIIFAVLVAVGGGDLRRRPFPAVPRRCDGDASGLPPHVR